LDAPAAAPLSEAEAALAEMRARFGAAGARAPGAPGNLAVEELFAERFKQGPFKTGEIRFKAPVFVPGKATLALPGRAVVELEPMHPTLMCQR